MRTSSIAAFGGQGGHSAQVTMRLLVNGFSMSVAQMGRDFVLVNSPVSRPPTTACLILEVDQTERRWNARLPEGISADARKVAIAAAE
jgi:hypothetical protein